MLIISPTCTPEQKRDHYSVVTENGALVIDDGSDPGIASTTSNFKKKKLTTLIVVISEALVIAAFAARPYLTTTAKNEVHQRIVQQTK